MIKRTKDMNRSLAMAPSDVNKIVILFVNSDLKLRTNISNWSLAGHLQWNVR